MIILKNEIFTDLFLSRLEMIAKDQIYYVFVG